MLAQLAMLGDSATTIIVVFLLSGALASGLIALARKLALRSQFVDRPNPNTGNGGGAAMGGGIAVVAAIGLMSFLIIGKYNGFWRITLPTTAVCLLGLIDDIHKLRPATKVIGQLACAALYAWLSGIAGDGLAVVLLFLILTSNAWNVVDVMDSLLGSIATVCLLGVGVVMLIYGLGIHGLPMMAVIAAGVTAGFALWNKPPAKILLGDAGSLALGLFYGILVIESYMLAPRLAAALILPGLIPFLEVGFLIVQRSKNRVPFYKTTPDHFALRLLHNGQSVPQIVAPVTVAGIVLSMLACVVALSDFDTLVIGVVAVSLGGAVSLAYRYFARLRVRGTMT